MRKSLGTYRGSSFNKEGLATRTTGELHLYADGTSGDDNNDGLTAATPKKTPTAILSLVPEVVKHPVYIHMSGTFTDSILYLNKNTLPGGDNTSYIASGGIIVFDGGSDRTDIGTGTQTATGASTSTLVVAGAGWVANAYAGYIVKVLTGPNAGEERTIFSNTTDTIYPGKNFTVSPGVGATFQICRPTTTITSTTTTPAIQISKFTGHAHFQNLYFTGAASAFIISECSGRIVLTSSVLNRTSGTIAFSIQESPGCEMEFGSYTLSSTGGLSQTGVGNISTAGITFQHCLLRLSGGFITKGKITIRSCQIWSFLTFGTNALAGVEIVRSRYFANNAFILTTNTGYQTSNISNSSGVGLSLVQSQVNIYNGNISNCSSHAIEANNSFVHIRLTTGSGNTGAGLYAHSGSVIHVRNAGPPTLTGTVGDVSTDGTTAATTWAAVDGGTAYTDLSECTVIKEASS